MSFENRKGRVFFTNFHWCHNCRFSQNFSYTITFFIKTIIQKTDKTQSINKFVLQNNLNLSLFSLSILSLWP